MAHRQLEDAVAIEDRLSDLTGYRQLLEVFFGFYRPLERRLVATADRQALMPDFAERLKTSWLEADLGGLGLTPAQIAELPDCPDLPRVDGNGLAWGCSYVLEGATLGGRHISAMLTSSAVPTGARRFFEGYGERTGGRWRDFVTELEQYAAGASRAEVGDIIHGASETFGCLHRWYVRQCPVDEFPG